VCEHSFDVLRQRGSDFVFYCRHCLMVQRLYVPVREPGGLEPLCILPADADVATAEAADNEAAACRNRMAAERADFATRVRQQADAAAVAIEGWLKCPDAAMPHRPAALAELIAVADDLLSCCPVAGLVPERDLEILLAARLAALERLKPAAVAQARDATETLIRSATLMLAGPVEPRTLHELAAVVDAVLAAAQAAGDPQSVAKLSDLHQTIIARLTAAQ
jgi:hypothetical protein